MSELDCDFRQFVAFEFFLPFKERVVLNCFWAWYFNCRCCWKCNFNYYYAKITNSRNTRRWMPVYINDRLKDLIKQNLLVENLISLPSVINWQVFVDWNDIYSPTLYNRPTSWEHFICFDNVMLLRIKVIQIWFDCIICLLTFSS